MNLKKILAAVSAVLLTAALPALSAVRIGVDRFSASAYVPYEAADALTDMFTTELANSGVFQVYERDRLEAVAREQRLSMQGMVSEDTLVRAGRLAGVEWIITGAITQYEERNSGGVLPLHDVGIALGNTVGTVVIDIRTIDTTTGAVTQALRCEGKATESAGGIATRHGVFGSSTEKDIVNAAAAKAVRKAVRELSRRLGGIESHVIQADAQKVLIDAGSSSGASVGDLFAAYEEGTPIRGYNGEILDVQKNYYSLLKVTQVKPNYSVCTYVKGRGGPGSARRGDLIEPIDRGAMARELPIVPRPTVRRRSLEDLQLSEGRRPSRAVLKSAAEGGPLFQADPQINVRTCTDERLIGAYNMPSTQTGNLSLIYKNGMRHYKSKNYRSAYEMFCRSAKETDFDVLNTYWAGMSALKLGKKADARKWLNRALEMHPDYEPARRALKSLR